MLSSSAPGIIILTHPQIKTHTCDQLIEKYKKSFNEIMDQTMNSCTLYNVHDRISASSNDCTRELFVDVHTCTLHSAQSTGTPTDSSQQPLKYRRYEHKTRVGIFTGDCLTRRWDALQLTTIFSSCESFSYVLFSCACVLWSTMRSKLISVIIFLFVSFFSSQRLLICRSCGILRLAAFRSICWDRAVVRF